MFLPSGSQDEYGYMVSNRNKVCEVFRSIITSRNFTEISTPFVEYATTFTNQYVGIELPNLVKWFNRNGEVEVLRPDWTSAIARALDRLKAEQKKWAYQGSVFREDQPGIEKRQIGIEIVNLPKLLGESECLFLANELLSQLHIHNCVIELGHTEIFEELTKSINLSELDAEKLRVAMHNKRKDEVYSIAVQYGNKNLGKELVSLIEAYGSIDILKEFENRWSANEKLITILNHLKGVIALLKEVGVKEIMIDLGRVKNLPYYSGIMFRGFLTGSGAICFSGGRYDKLYDQFAEQVSAVGLAFDVDILASEMNDSLEKEKICLIASEDTLGFAEKYRGQCKNSIVDILFEIDAKNHYDKILYVQKVCEEYEVIEA